MSKLTKILKAESSSLKVNEKKEVETKRPRGRDTKYDPKYCQMLIDHMAKGYSFASFTAIANVRRSCLYNWVLNNPEFEDAKKIAEDKNLLYWESLGIDLSNGKVIGNVTAWIFNMKNRHGWTDKREITSPDGSIAPKVVVYLPENSRGKKN